MSGLSMIDNLAALKAQEAGGVKDDEEQPLVAEWGHSPEINVECSCTQFSKDGEYLTVGCSDGSVAIYQQSGSPAAWKIVRKMGVTHTTQSGGIAQELQDNGKGVAMVIKFNPLSKDKFRVAYSDGQVDLYNAKNGSSPGNLKKEEGREANALDYSPDGDRFAVGGKERLPPGETSQSIRIVDENTNKVASELRGISGSPGHSNKIQCIRFKTPKVFASASLDGTVKLWSTGSNEPLLSLPQHQAYPVNEGLGSEESFAVVGQSVDFRDHLMIIGSNRPLKNLQIWDIRKMEAPLQTADVPWNRVQRKATSAAALRWNVARARFRNVCNVVSAQWMGDRLVAGGTGSAANEVKFFRNESTEKDAPPAYAPYASFKAPAGVLGLHVYKGSSSKPGLLAIAAKNGKVYGVRLPNEKSSPVQ